MAAAGRTTLLVAAAGYGKTTALDSGGAAYVVRAADWHAAGGRVPGGTTHLALDDLAGLPDDALAERLRALPSGLALTAATRHPPAAAVREALPGTVTEIGPADLALNAAAVARVLRDEHGVTDARVATAAHRLTGGWPALVHLAGDAVRRRGAGPDDLLEALSAPGTDGAGWVRDRVLADLPGPALRLLDALAGREPVDAGLGAALTGADPAEVEPVLRALRRCGVVVGSCAPFDRPGGLRVVPVLAAVLQHRRDPGPERDRWRVAAERYAAAGPPLAAAVAHHRAGDADRCAALLAARGDEMLAAGGAAEVIRLVAGLPGTARTAAVRLLDADARRMTGDVAGAERAFAPLLAAATARAAADADEDAPGGNRGAASVGRHAAPADRDPARADGDPAPADQNAAPAALPARLAWRAAMLRYLRAEYRAALALLDRAEPPASPPSPDDVHLLACRATVLVLLGDGARAAEVAAAALAAACGDGPRAAAHLAAALAATGVRRDAHLAEALAAAVRAGDVVLQARALVNQADCRLREANYPPALAAARRAVELGGPPGVMIAALHNAGEALTWLGRYDEAVHHFEWALQESRRISPSRAAAGLRGLGEVYRQLGRREQSMAAFEEAVELARDCADVQILVPALSGLARLHAEGARVDLAAARTAAQAAERDAPAAFRPVALIAQGWVALAAGEPAEARTRAGEAAAAARATRRSDLIAGALELAAAAAAEPSAAAAALDEATAIWQRAGAAPAADRLRVLRGRLPGADSTRRLAARAATDRLLALGVIAISGQPITPGEALQAPVRIAVLGRFDVVVGGAPVPLPAWRSRQARTLLKILVARRCRPVPRAELCELLWPDDEPRRTAHRLSVLLSAVRSVLDPDRRRPADHYVRADSAGISLDAAAVCVDAEDLLRDVQHADDLVRAGDPAAARALLADVDATYRGDAFDDEPYEDWADPLRELARAAWLRGLRRLAVLARSAGDQDRVVTCLVRLLAVDPYDDSAHRALVRALAGAGRHGEARRAFDRWAAAMRDIDAPPPDRRVLAHPAQQAYGPS
jgi:DNA-binding SARP family transcriptional activator